MFVLGKSRLYRVVCIVGFILLAFVSVLIESDGLFWISFLGMIVSIIMLISYSSNEVKNTLNDFEQSTEIYLENRNVTKSKSFYSNSKTQRIIFDHENELIHILTYQEKSLSLPYSQITESELIENGMTVTKSSRSSQLGGALIGGVLAGSAGAVIGGLSGSKTSTETVKDIEIKIISDNLHSPVSSFQVKDTPNDIEKSSTVYKDLYNIAYEIHKVISIIIKQQLESKSATN